MVEVKGIYKFSGDLLENIVEGFDRVGTAAMGGISNLLGGIGGGGRSASYSYAPDTGPSEANAMSADGGRAAPEIAPPRSLEQQKTEAHAMVQGLPQEAQQAVMSERAYADTYCNAASTQDRSFGELSDLNSQNIGTAQPAKGVSMGVRG